MKVLLCILFMTSTHLWANEEMELKMLKLEKRIKQLEKQKGTQGSGLKTQDYKNKNVSSVSASSATGSSDVQLTPEQKKALMEQIKTIKSNQKEQEKLLDELMNED